MTPIGFRASTQVRNNHVLGFERAVPPAPPQAAGTHHGDPRATPEIRVAETVTTLKAIAYLANEDSIMHLAANHDWT